MSKASGTFEVKLLPIPLNEETEDKKRGRMSIDKEFKGDLQGRSVGEMLSAFGEIQGSAGYVAIERVIGKLNGKKGSFILQHSAIMSGTSQKLTVVVVPDSGTEELKGLTGNLVIKIENGQHFYEFEYDLPSI